MRNIKPVVVFILSICFLGQTFASHPKNPITELETDSTFITAINTHQEYKNGFFEGDIKSGKFTGNLFVKLKNGIAAKGNSVDNFYGEYGLFNALINVTNTCKMDAFITAYNDNDYICLSLPFSSIPSDVMNETNKVTIDFLCGDAYEGMYSIEPQFEYLRGKYRFKNGITLVFDANPLEKSSLTAVELSNGDKVEGSFTGLKRINECVYIWAKLDRFVADYQENGLRSGDIRFDFKNEDSFKSTYVDNIISEGKYRIKGVGSVTLDLTNIDFLDSKHISKANLYKIGMVVLEDYYKTGNPAFSPLFNKLNRLNETYLLDESGNTVAESLVNQMYELQPLSILYPMPHKNLENVYSYLNNAFISYKTYGLTEISLMSIYKASKYYMCLNPHCIDNSVLIPILPEVFNLCNDNYYKILQSINQGVSCEELENLNALFQQLDYTQYSIDLQRNYKYLEKEYRWFFRGFSVPQLNGISTQAYAAYLNETLTNRKKNKVANTDDRFTMLGNYIVPNVLKMDPTYKQYYAFKVWMGDEAPDRKAWHKVQSPIYIYDDLN